MGLLPAMKLAEINSNLLLPGTIVTVRPIREILETTGEMRPIKDTVILEDCTCDGFTRWGFCPRDSHHLWREIWLRRA